MRFLLTCKAGAGHVGPLLPFAAALRAAGDDVLVVAPREARPLIAGAKLPYHPLPDPRSEQRDAVFAEIGELSHEHQGLRVMREVFAGIDTASALPGTLRVMDDFRPDAVLRDPTEYAGLLAAERLGVPHGRIAIMASAMESWSVPVVAPALDRHRERLGLRLDPTGRGITDTPYLTLFPAPLEDPGDSGPPHAMRFREEAAGTSPLPMLPDDDGRPLVYVTYGSVTPSLPPFARLFRATVEAMADLPARVLFTIGEADRDLLGPVPDNVLVESWVPQAAVMPHATAMLCHGGSGSTRMALAAGIPLVIVPGFADQPRNARRVAETGAGIALPDWPDGLAGIRDAVRRVLDEPSYRRAAARIADDVATLPAVGRVPEVMREWLAPARAA